MTITEAEAAWFADSFGKLVANVEQAVLGKNHVVRLAVACLITEGHLLLEDVPGTGKTSLAKAIAATVQGTHSRIQFTPDLLPSDVTGGSVLDPRTGASSFREGPVFTTILLADEINRASPKTQSALLEVMEEGKVTIDRTTHDVGRPFMVVATQNSVEQSGTYALPEAQLDRFLLRTKLGYPDHDTTVRLLGESDRRDRGAAVKAIVKPHQVVEMAGVAARVHTDSSVLGYISRLAEETRRAPDVELGVSVRGCLALVRAAKTWAAASRSRYVSPDHIKELLLPAWGHRVLLTADAEFAGTTSEQVLARAVAAVAPPTDRGEAVA